MWFSELLKKKKKPTPASAIMFMICKHKNTICAFAYQTLAPLFPFIRQYMPLEDRVHHG